MASQDKKQFSDIIGLIYESAQNPDLWPELLFHIDGFLGSHGNEKNAPHSSVKEENSDLTLLHPHFQRAIAINKQIYGLQTERNSISDILDQLPMGILLVDTKMSLVAMNTHARSILQSGKLLAIKNGMLVANSHKNTSRLQNMIMQTAELVPDIHNDHLNHSLLLLSPDASPCSLHIVPSNGTGISSQTNLATVLISSPDIQQPVSTKTLSQLYALTQMEARVLKLLMNGCHSLTEVSQKLGISKYTTRAHMKVIFEKTGTHSQAELLKKVLRHPTVFIGQKNSANVTLESLKALDIKPHQNKALEMFKMITRKHSAYP